MGDNRLLMRRQCVVEVYHPKSACLTFAEIKAELANRFACNEDAIALFDFFTKFGGGRTTGFALLYDNKDFKLKYEPKYRLRREELIDPKDNAKTRKTKKNLKIKTRKLRGKEKVKVMQS